MTLPIATGIVGLIMVLAVFLIIRQTIKQGKQKEREEANKISDSKRI
ncbi:FeoB-associated Cys-rich membrane protein [Mucilaginibacter koreensis]